MMFKVTVYFSYGAEVFKVNTEAQKDRLVRFWGVDSGKQVVVESIPTPEGNADENQNEVR